MDRKLFLTKEQLATHYFVDKMSQKDVARKYSVGRSVIFRLQKRYDLEPLDDWERRYPKELSQIQREVLYGSVLGDDCLYSFETSNYASLMVYHAISQEEYAKLKLNIWQPFVRYNFLKRHTRKDGSVRVGFTTGGHPEFYEMWKKVYIDRIKVVDLEHLKKLTPISLAFWFMDDGSRCKHGGLSLHTNAFRLDEIQLICQWFYDELKIICWPQLKVKKSEKDENQYIVFFSNKTSEKFAQIILPWILDSMKYKLQGIFLKNPQRLHANPSRLHELIGKI